LKRVPNLKEIIKSPTEKWVTPKKEALKSWKELNPNNGNGNQPTQIGTPKGHPREAPKKGKFFSGKPSLLGKPFP